MYFKLSSLPTLDHHQWSSGYLEKKKNSVAGSKLKNEHLKRKRKKIKRNQLQMQAFQSGKKKKKIQHRTSCLPKFVPVFSSFSDNLSLHGMKYIL